MADVSAQQVKELRDLTGAGFMDCKKALSEAQGDVEQARDILRKKGLARAASKTGRETREGVVESYVHSAGGAARLGAMVEVNCESDFVAATADFRTLAREIAIQVAGASPRWVSRADVPTAVVDRERAVHLASEAVKGKPEAIAEKIVSGQLEKFFGEVCLLDQVYVRDEKHKLKVADLIKEHVARLGENITVARFARFQVGESVDTSPDGTAPPES